MHSRCKKQNPTNSSHFLNALYSLSVSRPQCCNAHPYRTLHPDAIWWRTSRAPTLRIRLATPYALHLSTLFHSERKTKMQYVPFSAIIFLSLRRIAEGKRNVLNCIYKV